MSNILSGTKVRDEIVKHLSDRFSNFPSKPRLVIIQVGDRAESVAYIKRKIEFGQKIGAEVIHEKLSESVGQGELFKLMIGLSADPKVHGIIVQLPLPEHLSWKNLVDVIDPIKDVDGLSAINQKLLAEGRLDRQVPATARGIVELLDYYKIPIKDKKVTVMGRSALVGHPITLLLKERGAEVEVVHSQTKKPQAITKKADILIIAIGKPKLVDASYVKAGQILIDVGISKAKGILVGDVDFQAVKDKVGSITPVPGGAGPMTVVALFENLADAYGRLGQKHDRAQVDNV